jgi:polar amino acid transport system substrate-binding protein
MLRNLLGCLVAFAALALCAGQGIPGSSKAALVIAAEDGAGPWGQPDGSGCGNDIVLAAYAAVKVPAKLEVIPYSRAKTGVLSGKYVACFGMAWTDDMKGLVTFADKPLYSVTAMLLQNAAKPLKASNPRELPHGTKVGTVFEYEYPAAYYDLVKQGIIDPLASYSEINSLKNLDANRIDAALVVVDELKSVDYLIGKAGLAGRVTPAFSLGGQGTYLGFSTLHPQSEFARTKFNEGYALIARDGTLKRILETWKAKQR